MQKDLLSDLVLYHTERDKHVKNAAKALIAVFRELKPSMLEKKQRGRGADLTLDLAAYGAAQISSRCGTSMLSLR
jgi:protein SDA1